MRCSHFEHNRGGGEREREKEIEIEREKERKKEREREEKREIVRRERDPWQEILSSS